MALHYRIFMGFLHEKDLKIHLIQSELWKEAKISEEIFVQTNWQNKEYLGIFIPSSSTYLQLKSQEQSLKTQLQKFCPKLNVENYPIYLFSQVFIG